VTGPEDTSTSVKRQPMIGAHNAADSGPTAGGERERSATLLGEVLPFDYRQIEACCSTQQACVRMVAAVCGSSNGHGNGKPTRCLERSRRDGSGESH